MSPEALNALIGMSPEAVKAWMDVEAAADKLNDMQTVNMHQEMRMTQLQQRMHRDEQIVATRSSMDKAKHDALIAIIHNMT